MQIQKFFPIDDRLAAAAEAAEKSLSLIHIYILAYLGEHKPAGQFLCGFSMETQHMLENSRAKLKRKHLDMICANNLKVAGAGFGTDTNVVTLIQAQKEQELPLQSKEAVGHAILDVIAKTLS